MNILSRLVDRFCLAVYVRGHRAWLAPRLREAEKNRPPQRTAAEIKPRLAQQSLRDLYEEELTRAGIADHAQPASREYPIASEVRRNNPAAQAPGPFSHAPES